MESTSLAATSEADLLREVRDGFQNMQDHAKRTQLAHAIRVLETSSNASCAGCHSVAGKDQDAAEFEAVGKRVQQAISGLEPMLAGTGEAPVAGVMRRDLARWVTLYRSYLEEVEAGRFQSAHEIITGQMLPVHEDIDRAADRLTAASRERLHASAGEATRNAGRHRGLTLTLIGIAAIAIGGIVFILRRTSGRLSEISASLGRRAEVVDSMARQICDSSRSAAQGASEQADSLRHVTASSTEINTLAHRNAEKAGASAELSAQFSRSLGEANQRLEELLGAMADIQGASEKIAGIVRLIDEIAFQTNILSLNAAVEAARAGESGLGFAVVADEVRNLAQKSAGAAKETAALIDDALAAAGNGRARLADVSAAFQALTEGSSRVTELAGEVRAGSMDQVTQVEQITQQIEQIQELTASAGAGANQGACAGASLTEAAAGVSALTARLVEIVEGGREALVTGGGRAASMEVSP